MKKNLMIHLFSIILGCFSFLLTAVEPSFNDNDGLIPRKLLFGNPIKASPKISPDGTKLAYLAPSEENVLNIWVRDLKKEGSDRQITHDINQGIRSFCWQLDNQHFLYMQDKEGDENGHLYQVNVLSKAVKDLTPFEGVKAEMLAYEPSKPNEMLILLNKRDPSLFDVYHLDFATGKLELDTENPGGVIGWVVDHQLVVRAASSCTPSGGTLYRMRDQKHTPWFDWIEVPAHHDVAIAGFDASNHSVFLLSNLGVNTIELYKVDLTNGKQTLIAKDSLYDVDNIMTHPISHELEAIGIEKEKYDWQPANQETKKEFDFLATHLKGQFQLTGRDLADQHWLIASYSDIRPTHFYLFDRKNRELSFLFSTQPSLEQYKLCSMQPISFKARDGMTLYGYLTLPQHVQGKNLPSVLFVHGGPWVRDSWGLNPSVQWLANRGYAVLQLNYRGSTGYGKEYLNAGNREWGAKMHDDLIDGKNWLVQQGYSDPAKVAIYGGSYGGYATLAGLTFTPDAFCCGIDVVGPSNLVTLLQTFPPYWAPIMTQTELRIGKMDDLEFLKSRSPLFKADQIKKPLLIAQGANDPRVKQSESDQIVQAMRKNHLPVEYLLFSDEGHGFAKPHNRLKFYAAAEDFLAKVLGGRKEAPTSEENWDSLRK
jgi:dipeptidyl aminopeptidase/acylaminoacyl peptidase